MSVLRATAAPGRVHAALHERAAVETPIADHDVTVARWMMDSPPPPTYVKAGGFTANVDRWQFINFTAPCFVRLDVGALPTGKAARQRKTEVDPKTGAVRILRYVVALASLDKLVIRVLCLRSDAAGAPADRDLTPAAARAPEYRAQKAR